jgi:hypothetical protein
MGVGPLLSNVPKSAIKDYKRLFVEFHKRLDNLEFLNVDSEKFVNPETNLSYETTSPVVFDLYNITINRNIDTISQSASITDIPYDEVLDLFTKYDRVVVKITGEDNIDYTIFDGEIINNSSTSSLDSDSLNFELLDNLNLLNRINIPYPAIGKDIAQYISNALLNAGLLSRDAFNNLFMTGFLESSKYPQPSAIAKTGLNTFIDPVFSLGEPFLGQFKPTGNFNNFLSEIRKKYPLYIFGDRMARLNVSLPQFLYDTQLEVWNIDLNTSSAYINIENSYSLVNLIITIGFTSETDRRLQYGWAFDGISYAMNGGKINYRIEYAFDTIGYTNLTRLASNILVQENKNFKVKISNLPFFHGFDVGQFIKITNHRRISPEQIFFIEDLTHNLSINGFSTEITASAFSLGVIDEEILVGKEKIGGLLDPLINIEVGKSFRGQ